MSNSSPQPTKLRLALRLAEIDPELAIGAENGAFSDFESESPTPKVDLIQALVAKEKQSINMKRRQLIRAVIEEVKDGKYDDTKEEAEEWFNREGKDLLK